MGGPRVPRVMSIRARARASLRALALAEEGRFPSRPAMSAAPGRRTTHPHASRPTEKPSSGWEKCFGVAHDPHDAHLDDLVLGPEHHVPLVQGGPVAACARSRMMSDALEPWPCRFCGETGVCLCIADDLFDLSESDSQELSGRKRSRDDDGDDEEARRDGHEEPRPDDVARAADHGTEHPPLTPTLAAPPQPASVQAAVGSSDAACAAAGRNPRYKVDLGNGRRIRIVLDAGKTVGDLRESAELRAREMGETRALDVFCVDGFALDLSLIHI